MKNTATTSNDEDDLLHETSHSGVASSSNGNGSSGTSPRMREANELPPPSEWPKRPVFLCVNTAVVGKSFKVPCLEGNMDGPLPVGIPVEFESDLFKGSVLIRIRNVESDDKDEKTGGNAYFDNRRRLWQIIVQGRFKEEIPVADLVNGTEFFRPFTHMPPAVISYPVEKLLLAFSGYGCINQIFTKTPRIMSCIGSFARTIRADKPGCEPKLKNIDIKEDCSAFGGVFSKKKQVSRSKRSKYLSMKKNNCNFDTDTVYTFEYYDHLLDFATGDIDLFGLARIKHANLHDGQPTNGTARTIDGRYLWSFQIWHEDLLEVGLVKFADQERSRE